MAYAISNPRWVRPDSIDVTWGHPIFGPIEYTAVKNSGEPQMQEIWTGLMRGDFGPIAPLEDN